MTAVIDLFAGLGGWTEAAVSLGCDVRLAANHWPSAVAWHARNHPGVEHWTQDLRQANWTRVPAHDVLLSSPSCQGHSRARGKDRPHHDDARSTAWAVVDCAEVHRPPLVIVENVAEMREWELYPVWRLALERLGYHLREFVTDAADHGVPQNRVRLFVVASRRGVVAGELPKRAPVPLSAVADFAAGVWAQVDRPGRSAATLARVAAGRRQHGERFAVSYYGSTSGGRSLARPVGTLTTRARWALIDGERMRMLSVQEARACMGFRRDLLLPDDTKLANHLLGNAVAPPQAADVLALALQHLDAA